MYIKNKIKNGKSIVNTQPDIVHQDLLDGH